MADTPDYKAMYFHLAGQVADAIELLVQAQQEAEAAAMEDGEPPLVLAPGEDQQP